MAYYVNLDTCENCLSTENCRDAQLLLATGNKLNKPRLFEKNSGIIQFHCFRSVDALDPVSETHGCGPVPEPVRKEVKAMPKKGGKKGTKKGNCPGKGGK